MAELTVVEAVNQALALEMARDKRVVVFGEDVGRSGGVFRATDGLFAKHGAMASLPGTVRIASSTRRCPKA